MDTEGAYGANASCWSLKKGGKGPDFSLGRFFDFAVLNAGRADSNALRRAFHHRVDFLQIDVPAPLRQIVSMAYPVAKLGTTAAYVTHFRHFEGHSWYCFT